MVAPPGGSLVTSSVLVTTRSATIDAAVTESVSVAELFAGFVSVTPGGSVMVVVMLTVPLAAVTVASSVNVTMPPGGGVGTDRPVAN